MGKWKGAITYIDYTSGKPFTMPANVTISKDNSSDKNLVLSFEYPEEPKANGKDTLMISNDGRQVNGASLVSKKKNKDGNLEIVTEEPGVDGNDNQKAILRHIYTIGKSIFISRKEVKFEGQNNFMLRNEYKMKRY